MPTYMADFETIAGEETTRVWAYAICDIQNPESTCITGNSIEKFINVISIQNSTTYFHNLKFDGMFIMDWLFRNGYKHVIREKDRNGKQEELNKGEFSTVISDMGVWYKLDVCWINTGFVTQFIDSVKCIPLAVEKIPAAFGLDEAKLSIDYKEEREEGHILTKEEEDYVKEDVIIVAKALQIMKGRNQTKLTAASNALF